MEESQITFEVWTAHGRVVHGKSGPKMGKRANLSMCGRRESREGEKQDGAKGSSRGGNKRFYTTPVATPTSKCKGILATSKVWG